MTVQLSIAVRNARLDAIEQAIGLNPVLKIKTGPVPVNCLAADTGDVLASVVLPDNWMLDAVSGSKQKSGVWTDISADASGTAKHFRLYAADGVMCHLQGTVSLPNAGGDLIIDTTALSKDQTFTVTAFTLTDGNA